LPRDRLLDLALLVALADLLVDQVDRRRRVRHRAGVVERGLAVVAVELVLDLQRRRVVLARPCDRRRDQRQQRNRQRSAPHAPSASWIALSISSERASPKMYPMTRQFVEITNVRGIGRPPYLPSTVRSGSRTFGYVTP